MTDDFEFERDEVIERAARELKRLPPRSEAAVSRIMGAVEESLAQEDDVRLGRTAPDVIPFDAAERMRTPFGARRRKTDVATRGWRMRRLSLPIAAAITLAASLGGYALHGLMTPDASTQHASATLPVAPAGPARQGGMAVTYDAAVAESAPVQVQLVFDAPDARSVALVGDFNDWDAARAPMRSEGGGVWSTTLTLRPGRYVYAFVVNDREWRTDPRTPRVKDPDLGTESSVMIVGAR